MTFKPMLAVSMDDPTFPLLCTPKIDGIRGLTIGGRVVTRKLIEIPNRHIQNLISKHIPAGWDFEITALDRFGRMLGRNETQSAVMSDGWKPNFKIWVFDNFDYPKTPYEHRLIIGSAVFDSGLPFEAELLRPELIGDNKPKDEAGMSDLDKLQEKLNCEYKNLNELKRFYLKCDLEGYEGVIARKPGSPYKFGRSTLKEGYLMRYKSYEDSEAIITGFEEQYQNTNKAEVDELGNTKRSSAKSGKVPKGTLGSFWVRDIYSNVEFKISKGEGLTNKLRKEFWENRDSLKGRIIKYKYDPKGEVDKPQMASWLGFRDERDMS